MKDNDDSGIFSLGQDVKAEPSRLDNYVYVTKATIDNSKNHYVSQIDNR